MAFGIVTFSELTAMRKTFERLTTPEEQDIFYTKATKNIAARMLAQLIKNTPVGKNTEEIIDGKTVVTMQGGTLRRGWLVRTHAEAIASRRLSAAGNEAEAQKFTMKLHVGKRGHEYFITLRNNVKYASFVNDGHRQEVGRFVPAIGKRLVNGWVNGQYFVEISEVMIKPKIPAILKKQMNDYLNKKLKTANY